MKREDERIGLVQGSGGIKTQELVRSVFLRAFDNPVLRRLEDAASGLTPGDLALTTDAFVVKPLFFPGGDIGKLAVCGTVNDLVMVGARPRYLSLAVIVEEGFAVAALRRIADSAARAARAARVAVVTGDLKVVEKGTCDQLFLSAAGVGVRVSASRLGVERVEPGDDLVITGDIGRHYFSVLAGRGVAPGSGALRSDCAALDGLLLPLVSQGQAIKFMRDPTRGGVSAAVRELAEGAGCSCVIEERRVPLSASVRASAELFGIDPLAAACEGRALLVVDRRHSAAVVAALKRHPLGRGACVIGSVRARAPERVIVRTVSGAERVLPVYDEELLPRIC